MKGRILLLLPDELCLLPGTMTDSRPSLIGLIGRAAGDRFAPSSSIPIQSKM
jgi:hypothetical protein